MTDLSPAAQDRESFELRVVADWVEAQSLARPESVAALLRAEAERAEAGEP